MEEEVVRPDEDLDLKAKEKRLGKFLSRWCVPLFLSVFFFPVPSCSGMLGFPCGIVPALLSNTRARKLQKKKTADEKYPPFRLGDREANLEALGNNRLTTYKYTVARCVPRIDLKAWTRFSDTTTKLPAQEPV